MIYKTFQKVSNVCQVLDKSKYNPSQTINGVTFTNNGDGTFTANGTAIADIDYRGVSHKAKRNMIVGHKYLIRGCPVSGSRNAYYFNLPYLGRDYGNGVIAELLRDASNHDGQIIVKAGTVCDNLVFKPQLFDLTEMYGAGNEPTTVAQFRQDFPEEMYDYSPHCWLTSYKRNLVCETKNLFDIPLTRGYPSNTSVPNTTLRTFTIGTYILGLARNNFYNSNRISNLNISKNSISYKTSESGYGVSVPFRLPVGNTYTVSCKADNNFYPGIGISYYKEDGTLISYTESEVITNNPVKSFTVPENTYYTLILFYGRTGNKYTFSNIQLELGSTATDFIPNGYLQSYKTSLVCKTKNLFDISKVTETDNLKVIGNSIYSYYYPVNTNATSTLSIFKSLKPNTNYTMSAITNYLGDSSTHIILVFNNGSIGLLTNYTSGFIHTTFSLTQEQIDNINAVYFYGKPESQGGPVIWINIQIEEGNAATDYVPYGHL